MCAFLDRPWRKHVHHCPVNKSAPRPLTFRGHFKVMNGKIAYISLTVRDKLVVAKTHYWEVDFGLSEPQKNWPWMTLNRSFRSHESQNGIFVERSKKYYLAFRNPWWLRNTCQLDSPPLDPPLLASNPIRLSRRSHIVALKYPTEPIYLRSSYGNGRSHSKTNISSYRYATGTVY